MKPARQAEIIRLIENNDIYTQEELVERLSKSGFEVTQATISRDIRELKLTKISTGNGRVKYACVESRNPDHDRKYISVLNEALVSMTDAGNILVIKTAPGMAMAAAAVLDDLQGLEIAGTIAGDNTIFVATASHETCLSVMEALREMLGLRS